MSPTKEVAGKGVLPHGIAALIWRTFILDVVPDAARLELHLTGHDAQRLREALAQAELPARYEHGALRFDDPEQAAAVRDWHGRLSMFNRLIRDIAKREGRPIKPYKPMDEVNLVLAIMLGMRDGLSGIVHEVIWRQPFPNANHRTVTAAIEDALALDVSEEALRAAVTPLFVQSKALLDGSDARLTDDEAKQQHARLAKRLVEAIQSIK